MLDVFKALSFLIWAGLAYATAGLGALYVFHRQWGIWYKRGGKRASDSPANDRRPDGCTWYDRLRKPRSLPGTTFFVIAGAIACLLFVYGPWRVWITDSSSDWAVAFHFLALLHIALFLAYPLAMFGLESLFGGLLALLLLIASGAANLGLLGHLTFDDELVKLTPFILACIYEAWLVVCLVFHAMLHWKNRRAPSAL